MSFVDLDSFNLMPAKAGCYISEDFANGWNALLQRLAALPEADVVPTEQLVRFMAAWQDGRGGAQIIKRGCALRSRRMRRMAHCSACDGVLYYPDPKFCPHCGMRILSREEAEDAAKSD